MHKLWLIFAQTATICLAMLFVISTMRPELLPWNIHSSVVTLKEAPPVKNTTLSSGVNLNGYSDAAIHF